MIVYDELVAHDGLGLAVGRCTGMIYAGDSLVGSRDPEGLQGALNVLIGLFRKYGLVANIAKSKDMMCQPGDIQYGMSEEEVGWQSMGRGVTYKERLRRRIPCTYGGVELKAGSMMAYQRHMHRKEPEIDWNRLPASQIEPQIYVFDVRFPKVTSQCQWHLPDFPRSSRTWSGLRNQFDLKH